MGRELIALAYVPPLPAPSALLVSASLIVLTAFFFAWSPALPRRLFTGKIALGIGSIVFGSLAYALVWLIPIAHLRSWEFAVAVFALVNLCVFIWSYYVAWAYGAIVGALLMLTQFLTAGLIVLGVSRRIAVAAISIPGLALVLALAFWGGRIFKRGTTLGWVLFGWGPRTDEPNASLFYESVVANSGARAIERGQAHMLLGWIAHGRGDRDEAIHEVTQAIPFLGGTGATSRRAEAYRTLAQWLLAAGETEKAIVASSEAITVARSLVGGGLELARALAVRATANASLGNLRAAHRDANEATHLLMRVKNAELESTVRSLAVILTYEDLDSGDETE